jgi:1,4-alpha-glucan branching enzyme
MKKSGSIEKKRVEFRLKAEPGREIFIAGTFNDWDPTDTKLKENRAGLYSIAFHLPVGLHEYKFVVNGIWEVDPENPEKLQNAFGEVNSVITVG